MTFRERTSKHRALSVYRWVWRVATGDRAARSRGFPAAALDWLTCFAGSWFSSSARFRVFVLGQAVFPVSVEALVVRRKVCQDGPSQLQYVHRSQVLVEYSSIGVQQHRVGHCRLPVRVEGGLQGRRVVRREEQIPAGRMLFL